MLSSHDDQISDMDSFPGEAESDQVDQLKSLRLQSSLSQSGNQRSNYKELRALEE